MHSNKDVKDLERQERDLDNELSEVESFHFAIADSPVNLLANNLNALAITGLFCTFIALTSACSARLGAALLVILFRLIFHLAVSTFKLPWCDFTLHTCMVLLFAAFTQLHRLGSLQFPLLYAALILPEYGMKILNDNLISETENPLRVKLVKILLTTIPQICVCIICGVMSKGGFFFMVITWVTLLVHVVLICRRALRMIVGDSTEVHDDDSNSAVPDLENAPIVASAVEERQELEVAEDEEESNEQSQKKSENGTPPQIPESEKETRQAADKITQIANRIEEKKRLLEQKLADRSPVFYGLYRKFTTVFKKSTTIWIPIFFAVLLILQIINVSTWKKKFRTTWSSERYLTQVLVPPPDEQQHSVRKNNYYRDRSSRNNNNNNNNNNNDDSVSRKWPKRRPNNYDDDGDQQVTEPAFMAHQPRYRSVWKTREVPKYEQYFGKRYYIARQLLCALLLYCIEALIVNGLLSSSLSSASSLSESIAVQNLPSFLQSIGSCTPRQKRIVMSVIGFLLVLPSRADSLLVGFVILASIPFWIYRDAVEVILRDSSSNGDHDHDDDKNNTSTTDNQQQQLQDLLYEKFRADFVLAVLLTGFALHHAPKSSFDVAFFLAMVSYAGLAFVLFRSVGQQFRLI